MDKNMDLMEKIVSLCKRRGFIYPGSELYGGIAGFYDYGDFGVTMLDNIKKSWWNHFVASREDMFGLKSAIIMNPKVWEASGHTAGFSDPMSECSKCQHQFRTDQLENTKVCPDCGGGLNETSQFNLMFQTKVGASGESAINAYLRPEIAQAMFINFKNIVDSRSPKLPFGIAQVGRAFRNEITPRDFIFRSREFELMEFEYFVREKDWKESFEFWKNEMNVWMRGIGINMDMVHELEVAKEDRAHYSSRTVDFEFDYPFGRKELFGLAYRGDYDLKKHNLEYQDEENNEKIVPHVVEPTFGADRAFLATMVSAYAEDGEGDDKRVFLKLKPHIAPVICAVSPLLKNKPVLVEKSREIYKMLKKEFGNVMFDDNGNIGKRYRRQDEIGTPWCIVVDFDTLGENKELENTVTVRDRDTGTQERLNINELVGWIKSKMN